MALFMDIKKPFKKNGNNLIEKYILNVSVNFNYKVTVYS